MANEILDVLVGVLCPTNDAARSCTDFINASSHQVMAPIGPLFYFLLFPSVFIILFIYFLSNRLMSEHKGMRAIIAITVFIFIVISGLYPVALVLSELWYIFIVIFLGMWVFFFRGKGAGRQEGKMSVGDGVGGGFIRDIGNFAKSKAKNIVTGDEKDLEKKINDRLSNMRGLVEGYRKAAPGSEGAAQIYQQFWVIKQDTEMAIDSLSKMQKISGLSITNKKKIQDYWSKINKLSSEIENARTGGMKKSA